MGEKNPDRFNPDELVLVENVERSLTALSKVSLLIEISEKHFFMGF